MAAVVAAAVPAAASAQATFPGKNGRIAFEVEACCDYAKQSVTAADEEMVPVPRGAFVTRRDGRGPRMLTPRNADLVSYSPTGRLVAARSNGRLYVGDAPTGANARVVANDVDAYDWSPRGDRLAVIACCLGDEGRSLVTVLRVPGWEPVTTLDTGNLLGSIWWSPNGSHLAILRNDTARGSRGVTTIAPDGTDRRTVIEANFAAWAWEPTGRHLVFAVPVSSKCSFDLRTVDANGRHSRLLRRVQGKPDDVVWLTGNTIAFSRDPCGPARPRLEAIGIGRPGVRTLSGVWRLVPSPRLDRLAFVDDQDDIRVFDPRTGQITRLAPYNGANEKWQSRLGLIWSPDQSALVYTYEPGCSVRVVATDASARRSLGSFARLRRRLKGELESVDCAFAASWQAAGG